MQLNDRADAILRTADMLGGAIALATIYAMFPGVEKGILRRLMAKLVARKAFVWVWAGELNCKVFLTVHGDDGRMPGLYRWIKDSELRRRAIETGSAGRALKMPRVFIHAQITGLIAVGVSGGVAEFEREIWQQTPDAKTVADAYAWPERDRRIVIESERMVNQSPHRWESDGGLAERVAKSYNAHDNSHPKWRDEYLVLLPAYINEKHPDSIAELDELVRVRARKNHKNRDGAGWWSIDLVDLEADPVWHPFSGDSSTPRRPLPGIRSRRLAFHAEHEERAEVDRQRKARRVALTSEERTAEDLERAEQKAKARKKNRARESASLPESLHGLRRENATAGHGFAADATPDDVAASPSIALADAGTPEGY